MFTGRIGAGDELRSYAVPLKPRPYRHNVGLRPTHKWLLPGSDTPSQVAHKGYLLRERGDELVGVLPEDGAAEDISVTVAAVATAAGVVLPETGNGSGASAWGVVDDDGSRHAAREALAHVAANISEDICVMSRRRGRWQLVGAAVFFPSHWDPMSKLGGGLDAIHTPVPDYGRIAGATEQAFERIAASDGVWERFNWTLTPDDELCHTASADHGVGVTEPPRSAEQLWLRVERQTLTAVHNDLVIFGIRTFLTPLPELTESERVALGEAISGVSDDLAKYRSWLGYREAVSRWVDRP